MVLRGAIAGRNVADDADSGRVLVGEAKESAKAGSWGPLGELASILQFGIENVGRAAKAFDTAKVLVVGLGACKDLEVRKVGGSIGCVVVDPRGVVKGKGP